MPLSYKYIPNMSTTHCFSGVRVTPSSDFDFFVLQNDNWGARVQVLTMAQYMSLAKNVKDMWENHYERLMARCKPGRRTSVDGPIYSQQIYQDPYNRGRKLSIRACHRHEGGLSCAIIMDDYRPSATYFFNFDPVKDHFERAICKDEK